MREKELRLALVCYGGVSLAVYMHGITKEVWRLAAASRAHADRVPRTEGVGGVYQDLLAEIEATAGVRLRVLADIVAGASAGGVNGVFLAQAIATGRSLDPLTDLWLGSMDVDALLDPAAAPAGRFSRVWAIPFAWAAGRRGLDPDPADAATQGEVRAKISRFVRSRWFEPPFGGAVLTGLVLDALATMEAGPTGPRLLPGGQPLDLFVTVTDFTGHPERLALNSPPEVVETEHRLVLDYRDDGDGPGGVLADPAELAFAARATSSFPGAFPPFAVAELDGVLADRGAAWPGRRRFLRRVLPRQTAADALDATVLIDGSVLANAPFGPAVAALKDRPARREVDRRFVFIDPTPGIDLRIARGEGPPGFFGTILGAISDLPRAQPIRDNLEAIAERSARTERLRGVVDSLRPRVEEEVARLFGRTFFLDRPTPARLVAWRRRAQEGSMASAGYAHAAYGQLKIVALIDQLAALLAQVAADPRPERRAAIRAAITAHAGELGVTADPAGTPAIDFLRTYDLGFRIRRLRLLARRLAEIETEADTPETAGLRRAIYASLEGYLDRQRPSGHAAIRRTIRRARRDTGLLLESLAASLDLTRLDAEADAHLAEALAALPREPRRRLLLAYLGFPYFDTATLPLLQGEGLDEFDPIKVDRIAPDDARSIREGGAAATLKGIRFNNFGAFFSRAYRENDYLWGRLHGAERMIDIVVSALPDGAHLAPGRVAAVKRAAFLAILGEEEDRLTAIPALFDTLRREIG